VVYKAMGAAVTLDLSNGRFTNQPYLELFTECPSEAIRAQATHPVIAICTELHGSVAWIVMDPQIARNRPLDGVPY
jgi:hypothetical protein